MTDLRVDLIRRVQMQHMLSFAGVKTDRRAEEWRCRCGEGYKGDGAIEKGHRHEAAEILAALDEASVVA
jgi:hypothetical protein